ncbi:MAG: hypothetical protein WBP46_18740 [Thiolinea sp.]
MFIKKKYFIQQLFILLIPVLILSGCMTEAIQSEPTANPASSQLNPAEFEKLANHTLMISLGRGDARAVGGKLKPEEALPLALGTPPKHILAVVPQQNCALVGLVVETDNQVETREWLVMQDKGCTPPTGGWYSFWLVQQGQTGQARLLMSDQAGAVKMMEWTTAAKADSSMQRPVSVSRSGRTCPNCGSTNCEGFWTNPAGSYQRPREFLVENTRYDAMSGLDQSLDAAAKCPLD